MRIFLAALLLLSFGCKKASTDIVITKVEIGETGQIPRIGEDGKLHWIYPWDTTPETTVADLPRNGPNGALGKVIDAVSEHNCTVGAGTKRAYCMYVNGQWTAVAGPR